jgi:hypothetical protein
MRPARAIGGDVVSNRRRLHRQRVIRDPKNPGAINLRHNINQGVAGRTATGSSREASGKKRETPKDSSSE